MTSSAFNAFLFIIAVNALPISNGNTSGATKSCPSVIRIIISFSGSFKATAINVFVSATIFMRTIVPYICFLSSRTLCITGGGFSQPPLTLSSPPLNRARRFGADIVNHAVYPPHLVDDAVRYAAEKFLGQPRPVGGHGIVAGDGTDGDDIF